MFYGQLRTLAEGANGYVNGTGCDYFPEMTLEEAMSRLPVVCLESQREFIDMGQEYNTAMVEAAVTAIQTGSDLDVSAITEASLEGIKKKIKDVFEKIKKFIRSIINKLKMAIDKLRMTGHQLWAKYKDSEALKQDFSKSELVYNGYKFKNPGGIFTGASKYDKNVEGLINASMTGNSAYIKPSDFESSLGTGDFSAKGAEGKKAVAAINALKNTNQKDREKKMVKELTGIDVGEEWKTTLNQKMYGEKVDIKYGSDGFTKDEVGKILGGDNKLDDIKSQYEALEAGVNDYESALNSELDKHKEASSTARENSENVTNVDDRISLVSQYYTTYTNIVHQAISVISAVKTFNWNYEKARYDQAKGMLVKMLGYKAPKNNADASDIDVELMMFDFDLN